MRWFSWKYLPTKVGILELVHVANDTCGLDLSIQTEQFEGVPDAQRIVPL